MNFSPQHKRLLELGKRLINEQDDSLLVNHELIQKELTHLVGASHAIIDKALIDFSIRIWINLAPRVVQTIDFVRIK